VTIHYDDLNINEDMLLDLPFREGVGAITQDVAKPHHPVTLVNTPTWTTLASGLTVLTLNGTNEYIQSLNADTDDLEFTTEDYSMGGWIYIASGGDDSQIIAGRYQVDVGGWELYHYTNGLMTLRHHHAGGTALRSAVYSAGWGYNTWYYILASRSGTAAQHYRYTPGGSLETLTMIGALEDPEATTSNLRLGVRFNGTENYHKGMRGRWRTWGRTVSQVQCAQICEREKGRFA